MQKLTFKHKKVMRKQAFTLIELLIVIAIIGILFIVLVSKVDFATDKAKATGVQTDFRSFQVAIESVAKEHAGLATFGWDTGDTNGNRIRDSYDKGDVNKNGKQDPEEVFVGSKTYGETWNNVYTLTNPADTNDTSAITALETAINKNLDPKLHITIADDLTITMSNGAQDPWNTEYHGCYITNALNDGKDRGAIVIYSNGANQEWGSEHSISNGIVVVNVPGNNVYGKDDYSIATVYTYANGYGEIKTSTSGFSNNQVVEGDTVLPAVPGDTNKDEEPTPAPPVEPIVYQAGIVDDEWNVITPWEELVANGMFFVYDGDLKQGFILEENLPEKNEYGFYFGVPYLYYYNPIIFYADGSADFAGTMLPANSLVYSNGCIDATGIGVPVVWNIVLDGRAFTEDSDLFPLGEYGPEFTDGNLVLPNDGTIITNHKYGFANTNLKKIVLPDSLSCISSTMFGYCESLTDVIWSANSSVSVIEQCAFIGAINLRHIEITTSVQCIEAWVFDGCDNLTINYRGTEEQWNAIDKDPDWNGGLTNYTIVYNYSD